MIRAPRRAMESLVALPLLNFGMNIPIAMSFTLGWACTITLKKHPPTIINSTAIASSSFRICIHLGNEGNQDQLNSESLKLCY